MESDSRAIRLHPLVRDFAQTKVPKIEQESATPIEVEEIILEDSKLSLNEQLRAKSKNFEDEKSFNDYKINLLEKY